MAPHCGPCAFATTADAGSGHLAVARATAHLEDGFVQEREPVHAPGGELPPVGVEGHRPAGPDARAVVDPVVELPDPAEPERLEPRDRDVGEAVVELGDVDVSGGHRGPPPELVGTRDRAAEEEVVGVEPVGPAPGAVGQRVHEHRGLAEVGGTFGSGQHRGTRRVHGVVAVEQQQRIGDHPRVEVVVHRDRLTEHRAWIERSPTPGVERDLAVVLDRSAELGDSATLLHRHREDDPSAVAVRRGELQLPRSTRRSFAQPAVVAGLAGDRPVDECRLARTGGDRHRRVHRAGEPRGTGAHDVVERGEVRHAEQTLRARPRWVSHPASSRTSTRRSRRDPWRRDRRRRARRGLRRG